MSGNLLCYEGVVLMTISIKALADDDADGLRIDIINLNRNRRIGYEKII